jgi:hypothetical protein
MAQEQSLEAFLEETPPVGAQERVSRRQFLTGAMVGGAAGLAVAAGTGAAVWKITDAELLAAKEVAEAELAATKAAAAADVEAANEAANIELARLLGLLDLYEELEKVGLDNILEAGMAALAMPLAAVEVGASALKSGLEWAEGALISLAEAVPTAQESLLWLETRVSAVAESLEKLQAAMSRALDLATSNPVGAALEDFTNKLLNSLPFGLGERFRDGLEGLVVLVTSVDELVEGINTSLLEPLRERWFSDEDGQGVGSMLVDPLVEHILDPLGAHLGDLEVLADTWQNELMNPTQNALADRSRVREEIARYKQEHGLV